MKFELKTIAGTPAVLMCLQDVQVRTTLSRSSIYRLMNENVFPRSIALSQHRVAWLASEVDAFIAGRVTASRVAQDRSFEGQQ